MDTTAGVFHKYPHLNEVKDKCENTKETRIAQGTSP